MKFSIVVPIYNEEETITKLYNRIIAVGEKWNESFELLLVDDGSYDSSLDLMREICSNDSRVRIISLSRNFGHQAAISAGISKALGKAVIIMDGDLQDPPEELYRFINKWKEGYDVVYAIRKKRKENIFKKSSYYLFYRFLKVISNINIPLDSGDFCILDRKVVNTLVNEMPENNRFVRGLRAYAGYKQIGVEYDRDSRYAGEVKYTFSKLFKLALDGIYDFSTAPLKLASFLGFLISIPSFLLGIFFIIHRVFNFKIFGYSPSDTPGLATLAVGMFFLGGILLIMLGIIGEYIGRIYFEVKKRPQYIINQEISNKS